MPSRVFVTRRIPKPGLDLLAAAGVRTRIGQTDDEAAVPRAVLEDGVRWGGVLVSLLTEPVDAALLALNPRLLGVANCAVGYDNIDVAAATALGIPVSNTPGILTDSTADFTWALLLAVARRVPEGDAYVRAGRYKLWGVNLMLGADVSPGGSGQRKVLGVIGYGRIGAAVARRAAGFEMDVLAYDPEARARIDADPGVAWAELDDLLAQSDFVTLHPALTDRTRHLIDARALRRMKRTAYLINVARGPVVDEAALVAALRGRRIAGAALDVFEREPALAPGLLECDNVVLAPHMASASVDTRGRMAAAAAENALAHLRGERAPDIVNSGVYETAAYRERTAAGG
ncbi:MAG: D-glycerate dehydrogenase [Gemmatimonadota bacterium]|nr:D-glycerate dehydrogenase [Gemmatimonadota bacterium]